MKDNEFNELDDFMMDEDEDKDVNRRLKEIQQAKDIILNTNDLLRQIEALVTISRHNHLSDDFFDGMNPYIQIVADKLMLTPLQTILLLPFVDSPDCSFTLGRIASFFNCTSIQLLRLDSEFTTLVRRRYLCRDRSFDGDSLCLSDCARKSLISNKGLEDTSINGLSPQDFMSQFRNLLNDCCGKSNITPSDLREETLFLVNENPELGIVKGLKDYQLNDNDTLITLYFCKRLVCDFQKNVTVENISRLFEDFYSIGRALQRGTQTLVKKGILEPYGKQMLIKEEYKLSEQACKKLLSEYDVLDVDDDEETGNFRVIKASEIKPKSLFYSEKNKKEIKILADLLSGEHFNEIRKNLENNNMRSGFNCLFHGAPGTGKTETVLQLARATGRDIMQVDISSIRDMWYGNTEKLAREIFDKYAELVKKRTVTPILLFNEADALLSVRTQINNGRSTDKTENAIQNIFLEGMESLDGIMIATTNLTENLDKAFERRFIFKICFEQPNIEAKTAIWKSFFNDMSDTDAQYFANNYDFSGGQIENVARKCFVEKLLFSESPSRERIAEICDTEKLDSKNDRRTMGFKTLL